MRLRTRPPLLTYLLTYSHKDARTGTHSHVPQAKHIISKGIGEYASPILQPTTPVAHLTTGLAIYAYLPMTPYRLPQPSPADLLFFTDAQANPPSHPSPGGPPCS